MRSATANNPSHFTVYDWMLWRTGGGGGGGGMWCRTQLRVYCKFMYLPSASTSLSHGWVPYLPKWVASRSLYSSPDLCTHHLTSAGGGREEGRDNWSAIKPLQSTYPDLPTHPHTYTPLQQCPGSLWASSEVCTPTHKPTDHSQDASSHPASTCTDTR